MTRKLFGPLTIVAVAMALVLAACGADPTATPVPTPTPPPGAEPTPTLSAEAQFQAEWEALIAAAQEEGEISMTFGGSAGRNFRPIAAVFEERFGVKTIVATGSGGEHVNRILAEQTAGQFLVDVHFGGNTATITRLAPTGALNPVADLLFHPEVIDQSLWVGGKHSYSDPPQQFVFAFAANASPNPIAAWLEPVAWPPDLPDQAELRVFLGGRDQRAEDGSHPLHLLLAEAVEEVRSEMVFRCRLLVAADILFRLGGLPGRV